MWRNCNRLLFHSFYITNRKGKTCKWFFPFIANKREKLEICVFPSIANKADKVFSFQLKTYFLKALHFVNFKNSEIKRVTRLEYANCNERNLFIEKCCIKAISIYIDIFLKDHIIVVGKTLHSLLL
ncbi:hypothetical protein DW227_06105 [Clostridium sp. AM18-55]|nr:hypothetical protein DW227_06105 [Clostridium sp. AM18-55]